MPIDALKTAAGGRLRVSSIEEAGIRTVASVLATDRRRLEAIPGVGEKTSTQLLAAAHSVEKAVREVTRVRIDVETRSASQTELLSAIRDLEPSRQLVEPVRADIETAIGSIDLYLKPARLETQRVRRLFTGRRKKEAATDALRRLTTLLADAGTVSLILNTEEAQRRVQNAARRTADVWDDYLTRSVVYNGLLIELAGLDVDSVESQGFLPEDIVERIAAFDLDVELLTASLRGYQSFGAKFALVQKRTILGDEMGLGKTLEALAVLCHLRSGGATHFLVISPASVLANWEHEIARHTKLGQTWRLHGPERDWRFEQWIQSGGVATTTFGTLGSLPSPTRELAAVVVDEAHYIKNPNAQRTKAVRSWLGSSSCALLMSGTPMENRVEEFRTLADHIRPDVAAKINDTAGVAGADAFRKAVAPIYLRRNQIDVLDELPPKIETADWVSLSGSAATVYREAVATGNFMAMRRAAFLTPQPADSPKLIRLLEIVSEAERNDRKVVVFSFFRDVLDHIHHALGDRSAGTLTGSVPAAARQRLIDEFSSRVQPGVLVSQIEAGGVGLNIQTASVVILCEPQWKPSTEEQAIARCHRMGQVRPVEVHRLLTENSVDEHMLRILARKSALFADYVRSSAMKDATPDAIDITDHDATQAVVSQADQEHMIIELERERLGLPA